tara:strand:+ start:403 stop:645 length:243 start_codon:yes stop_codon:yes gene_type:complete
MIVDYKRQGKARDKALWVTYVLFMVVVMGVCGWLTSYLEVLMLVSGVLLFMGFWFLVYHGLKRFFFSIDKPDVPEVPQDE